jgi:SAM-dependent methyltransferase
MIARYRLVCSAVAVALSLALSPVSGRAESREEWQQPGRVMGDLAARLGDCWADIGCGDGYFALRLAKAVGPQGAVYGADISERALASLKSQAERQRLTNVVAVLTEIRTRSWRQPCVGAALICDVLHEMPARSARRARGASVRSSRRGALSDRLPQEPGRHVRSLRKADSPRRAGPPCTEAGLTLDAEFHYLKYQVFLRFRKRGSRVAWRGGRVVVSERNDDLLILARPCAGAPKRALTLFDSTAVIVGIIIGVGVYQNAPLIERGAQGCWGLAALWALGGLLLPCGALGYASWRVGLPAPGGDYVYLSRAYGPWAGFLFGWMQPRGGPARRHRGHGLCLRHLRQDPV